RFLQFIEGQPLYAYGIGEQVPLISSFFGGADVHVMDAALEIAEAFPAFQGRSLEELEKGSRLARYFPENSGALTTLRNLMITRHYRAVSGAFDSWRRGLDLVALGTLADLMPLKDENRIMVRMGLKRINVTDSLKERRAALRELLVRQRLHEGRIGTTEIAWQLCPLINASGRMGRADVGVKLFLDSDQASIASLADELVSLNKKRRALGEEFWDKIRPRAYKNMEELGGRMVIVADNGVPRGITGILATRLQKTMDAAAVVISVKETGASGSIRCDSGMNALGWLEAMSSLLDDFGGHPQAGGFRIPGNQIEALMKLTKKWLTKTSHAPVEPETLSVDAELSHEEITRLGPEGLESLLERLEPYGEGFRPLTFLTRSVKIFQADLVGKPKNNHLKLLVSLGSKRWPALWWDGAERYGTIIKKNAEVDLIYRIDRDHWRGPDARR
ncbi:MAG: single-stranded-DNA-specific exonuclease RecJ, partial [Spirochaetaceae bacterium]|nr:single-stranded-DNA-specific exonuclease RecJ [Spirochaetaceae bacterium]